jgi:hypothetical protein
MESGAVDPNDVEAGGQSRLYIRGVFAEQLRETMGPM